MMNEDQRAAFAYHQLEDRIHNEYPDLYYYIKNLMPQYNKDEDTWAFCHKLLKVVYYNTQHPPTWADVYEYVVKNEHMHGIWML